jgi:hypothetical protein
MNSGKRELTRVAGRKWVPSRSPPTAKLRRLFIKEKNKKEGQEALCKVHSNPAEQVDFFKCERR